MCELSCTLCSDMACALRVKHKAHGVDSCSGGGVDIFLAGQSANLDAGTRAGVRRCKILGRAVHALDYGNQSKAGVRVGRP